MVLKWVNLVSGVGLVLSIIIKFDCVVLREVLCRLFWLLMFIIMMFGICLLFVLWKWMCLMILLFLFNVSRDDE